MSDDNRADLIQVVDYELACKMRDEYAIQHMYAKLADDMETANLWWDSVVKWDGLADRLFDKDGPVAYAVDDWEADCLNALRTKE